MNEILEWGVSWAHKTFWNTIFPLREMFSGTLQTLQLNSIASWDLKSQLVQSCNPPSPPIHTATPIHLYKYIMSQGEGKLKQRIRICDMDVFVEQSWGVFDELSKVFDVLKKYHLRCTKTKTTKDITNNRFFALSNTKSWQCQLFYTE